MNQSGRSLFFHLSNLAKKNSEFSYRVTNAPKVTQPSGYDFDSMRMARSWLLVLVGFLAAGCAASEPPSTPLRGHLALASSPAYSRAAFGTHWKLVRGHCDVREIDLERAEVPPGEDRDGDGCRDDGPLRDAYTGTVILPAQAQIDHVFPLKAAWLAGADGWAPAKRHAFYNDLDNTIAVTGRLNESKGERTISQWQPPDHTEWCDYARRYAVVATRYELALTAADQAAVTRMEHTCP